ncbi:MAG: phenylalanine--tRNA ligase subunit alpha [bacterium]|nr:phenylalanine--tRNA ligase subunit alpha [bacterium]
MTELIYLTDSYRKNIRTKILSVTQKGDLWELILEKTIFYPQGGGQPSDKGTITGAAGSAKVKHVRLGGTEIIHECSLDGTLEPHEDVDCTIDWELRYRNMRIHSAGHIVHEAVMLVAPALIPRKGDHGSHAYIEYSGTLEPVERSVIQQKTNEIIERNIPLHTEFVTLSELKQRASYIPEHLPENKPLRILTIEGFRPIPDGGTHVQNTSEVGSVTINEIEYTNGTVRVHYSVKPDQKIQKHPAPVVEGKRGDALIADLLNLQQHATDDIQKSPRSPIDLQLKYLESKSELAALGRQMKYVAKEDKQRVGIVFNDVKKSIERALKDKREMGRLPVQAGGKWEDWALDITAPGVRPPEGHLHIVTQAIMEITRIFEHIGFTRVRHPEVDWDWYAFESLNMPPSHPARDEWETFFIRYPGKPGNDPKKQTMVLTPHTSNGQVREMEKGKLPIRMINIAKCYRRQSDVSHVPMFHQFEGLLVDKNVSIGHLKGVFDYFVKCFYGENREIRLRPFHFQFTEPSFEVDINCGICLGSAKLPDGTPCKLCKSGWLELGGAGMVHPTVLKNGGIDPSSYSGFAFGWGIERTYMMRSGTNLDDIRLLYSNDIRFLEQF